MYIPRWIRRREPKLVPIGPAVWQLPKTFECLTPKPPQVPPCVSRGNLFGVYPFPDGSADVCQIWCQSVQPFDSFPRLLNLWHPPPPQCPLGYWGATCIYPMSIPRWIRRREPKLVAIGQLLRLVNCWPPKPHHKCPTFVSRGNLFGLYPFPYEFANVCQIWCLSAQPFGSFSRICAKVSSAFRRCTRWLAQKHAKKQHLYIGNYNSGPSMQTSTSLTFFTAIFVAFSGALAEELMIFCRRVRTELYI